MTILGKPGLYLPGNWRMYKPTCKYKVDFQTEDSIISKKENNMSASRKDEGQSVKKKITITNAQFKRHTGFLNLHFMILNKH